MIILFLLGITPALAHPFSFDLLARQNQNTCSANDLTSCPSGLPSSFCCPSSSRCLALAGDTTAICCPKDDPVECARILPITCSLDMDPDDLTAPFKTTVTDIDLETCGSGCCPFGYSCADNGLCTKDKDQSEKPEKARETKTTTTTAPEQTSTSTETAPLTIIPTTALPTTATTTPTSSPTTSPSESNSSSSSSSGPDTTSIIGGVVGGCFVLLLIAVIIFLYIRRNNRRNAPKPSTPPPRSGPSRAGNNAHAPITVISEPIMNQNSYRTDFILGQHAEQPQPHLQPTNPRISIKNPFDQASVSSPSRASSVASCDSEQPRTGQVTTSRLAPIRAMKAQSRRPRLSGSSWLGQGLSASPTAAGAGAGAGAGSGSDARAEKIDIFADPDVAADNRYTTFSDLLEEADLGDVQKKGRYVPGTTPRI